MADYKKKGKIGDSLYMESKDGGTFNAGIVTDIKDGKIITKDADGKKHQYSEDNKKIVGFMNFADAEIHDEPASIADTAPIKPVIASESSSKEINNKKVTQNLEAIPEVFTGIVNTNKSKLNIRSGAGLSFPIIGTLAKGSKVQLKNASSGWYKLADRAGYVSANYIKKT